MSILRIVGYAIGHHRRLICRPAIKTDSGIILVKRIGATFRAVGLGGEKCLRYTSLILNPKELTGLELEQPPLPL